jgi:DNA-binding response OmpR family regulator
LNTGLKAAFMEQGLSPATSSQRPPRLLIAEKTFSAIEPLIETCGDKRLNVDFDVCASHRGAVGMLLAFPYQLVISGAHLTEMEDFLLLRRIQALDPFVPLVVTASGSERDSARRVLAKGAFDCISTPLDHEQAVRTIRLALWQNKLMDLIARKEKAMNQYRRHVAEYPYAMELMEESFIRALTVMDKTIYAIEHSIQRIEESSVCFADFASKVAFHARKGALERLDKLPSSSPSHVQPHMCSMTSLELQEFRETILDSPRQNYLTTLTDILRMAIRITSADMGNIQTLDPLSRTLHTIVHEGFDEPFLRFFKEVNHREAACGTALKLLERVIVENVRESPIFADTEARDVLREAGVQAVQSTPVITNSGCIVGMISTHYRVPTRPTREQLHLLDELAKIAAELIDDRQVT